MLVRLFVLVIICLVLTVSTERELEDACERRKSHINYHLLPSETECGRVKINQEISSRILNGHDAPRGSLPWMAYILMYDEEGNSYPCQGTLINNKYVLTSAGCVKEPNVSNTNITVYLGVEDRTQLDDGIVEAYNVTGVIPHKDYDSPAIKNDVALIRLGTTVNTTSVYINYICLPMTCDVAQKDFVGEKLLGAGWGMVNKDDLATILQRAELPVKKCQAYAVNGGRPWFPEWSQLCAGDGDVKTCAVDTGSPLVYETGGRFVQIAVDLAGQEECTHPLPGVYAGRGPSFFTKVAKYVGWILKTIEPA